MSRYILAPAAAKDLVEIWRYLRKETSEAMADHVEAAVREKMGLLASAPALGHLRRDLTSADVRFFGVYSYLIVYRPLPKPLQVVAVLHGARDVHALLRKRV